jgi:hypothetical protein
MHNVLVHPTLRKVPRALLHSCAMTGGMTVMDESWNDRGTSTHILSRNAIDTLCSSLGIPIWVGFEMNKVFLCPRDSLIRRCIKRLGRKCKPRSHSGHWAGLPLNATIMAI